MSGDPYIPRSWGGGCTAAALYKQLRERRMPKFEAAQAVYRIIRTHPDVVTDPELPPPVDIIPQADTEDITIVATKPTKAGNAIIITLDGAEVRINYCNAVEIDLPNVGGQDDQYDWRALRDYLRNLYHRAMIINIMGKEGAHDEVKRGEPDLVGEARVFFERMYGKDPDGNVIMPSDRRIREQIQLWRGKGDYRIVR